MPDDRCETEPAVSLASVRDNVDSVQYYNTDRRERGGEGCERGGGGGVREGGRGEREGERDWLHYQLSIREAGC